MAPLIVLHCLLCCSAFQMGDNIHTYFICISYARVRAYRMVGMLKNLTREKKCKKSERKHHREEKPTFDPSGHDFPCLLRPLSTSE